MDIAQDEEEMSTWLMVLGAILAIGLLTSPAMKRRMTGMREKMASGLSRVSPGDVAAGAGKAAIKAAAVEGGRRVLRQSQGGI
jgi:hypothetical protein